MTSFEPSQYSFWPSEPELPQGDNLIKFYFQSLVNRYIQATRSKWKAMPEFYLTNLRLVINRLLPVKESIINLTKWAYIGIIEKRVESPVISECDVMLCYSTPKSIWQFTMDALVERLARQGYRIALVNSRRMQIVEYQRDRKQLQRRDVERFTAYRDGSSLRLRSVRNLFRSLGHIFALFFLLKEDRELREELFHNPFSIWLEYFSSLQQLDFANKFLQQIRPRLIVSNHIVLRFIAELLASDEATNIHRIWFCNENPAVVHIPAGVCDEIWFWNQLHMNSHCLLVEPDADIHMEIIGHAETDMAVTLDTGQLPVTEEEARLKDITRGRRVLLYLSTYYPSANGIDLHSDAVSLELADWLEYVSTRHPDWYFIYKDRPVRFGENVPGFDRLKKLPNWLFPQTEINFLNFLKWDNLAAVAADSSLGLIATAGMEKLPIWLSTPSREEHFLPNVEQVSLRVFSAETFDSILSTIDDVYPAYQKWFDEKQDEIFPHRGAVLDRMEELCIRRLSA